MQAVTITKTSGTKWQVETWTSLTWYTWNLTSKLPDRCRLNDKLTEFIRTASCEAG